MSEWRKELLTDKHNLPNRFWEPEPDEEDLRRIEQDNIDNKNYRLDDEPLPFD